ncbi:MAG: MFS transporter [Anaerolineae bacterium]|nr:MFS transporter [Anaerolineae bacterium]
MTERTESLQSTLKPALDEFQAAPVATIAAGHAIHDTYTAFLNPLLPTLIENLSLTNTHAGLLTVFLNWPSMFQPILGHLSDRFRLQRFFTLAPAVSAIAMSLIGIAPSYGFLAMLMVVTGVSSASLHAVGPAMAGKLSGRKLGRGMSYWMVGGEVARTLGPIIIVGFVQLAGLNSTPWLMLAGILASFLLWTRLKKTTDQQPAGAVGALHWQAVYRQLKPLLLPLAGVVVARRAVVAALSTYLPILLTQEGATMWLTGISLTVYEAAGVLGALLGGSISDRIGRRSVIFSSLVIVPALMFVFLAVSGPIRLALLVLLGFTALSVTPVMMALVQDAAPDNRALANGMYMAMNFGISSLVTVLLGFIGDKSGIRTSFVVSAVTGLVGIPFVLWLPKSRGE